MKRRLLFATPALLLPRAALAQGVSGGASAGGIVVATAGQLNLTGPTTETNIASLRIPGGSMGKNGAVEVKVLWAYTNSSNNKTLTIRLGATAGITAGGATGGVLTVTTTGATQTMTTIRNNNATNSQVCYFGAASAPFGSTAATFGTIAADTTADTFICLNGTLALGSETITLVHAIALIYYAP